MALTNKGTDVYINASYLPEGYTRPTVDKFSDYEAKYPDYTIVVAKSGVENASKVTTMQNLVTAITNAVSAVIEADYDTSANDVTCFANLKILGHNFDLEGVMFSNGAIQYRCTVDIFVKTTAL